MAAVIESITAEFRRYKALGEGAIAQLSDAELVIPPAGGGNSVATICWHMAGNLRSRFTDFLTSDGEKPWRDREEEFKARHVIHAELLEHWERGWGALLATLSELQDGDLDRSVVIRGQHFRVDEALHRALAHAAYHVGQIVFSAKALRGPDWRFLSIPPGQSEAFNRDPALQRADAQAAALNRRKER